MTKKWVLITEDGRRTELRVGDTVRVQSSDRSGPISYHRGAMELRVQNERGEHSNRERVWVSSPAPGERTQARLAASELHVVLAMIMAVAGWEYELLGPMNAWMVEARLIRKR